MITPEQLRKRRSDCVQEEIGKIEERIIHVNDAGGSACTWSCSSRISNYEASNIAAELHESGYKVRLSSGVDMDGPYNVLYIIWS